jgi:hypothetical protein
LQLNAARVRLVRATTMNPDKLFDYLDGKLPAEERAALEERFMSEPELRKELAVARQIHAQMGLGDSREVIGTGDATSTSVRGAILAQRIMIVFSILVVANVAFGIYAIFFMKNRERAKMSVEKNRTELAQSLARSAAVALPTPSLDIDEIKFTAPVPEQDNLANTIIAAAQEAGGSGTKGLADQTGVLLFAEIPTARVNDFRESMRKLGATLPAASPAPGPSEKTILQIRIVSSQ